MPLNFPSSPVTGQQYTGTNGVTYVFNGSAWAVFSANTISIIAYDKANAANVLAYNTGIGANSYASAVGAAANAIAVAAFDRANTTGAKGGDTDKVFWENSVNITSNYTITANHNAGTFGPVTIQEGVIITVPEGSTWSVV